MQYSPPTVMASRPLRLLTWAMSLIALFNAATALSQDQEGERRVVVVDVLDRQGNHVSDLTSANFRAEFRGQPVTILSVTEDTTPHRIAVVVDVSASEAESTLREWVQAE